MAHFVCLFVCLFVLVFVFLLVCLFIFSQLAGVDLHTLSNREVP